MPGPKDIETFLADYPPEVREVALAARRLLNRAIPGAAETLDEEVVADVKLSLGFVPEVPLPTMIAWR
jgi:hypothetical protein